MTSVLYRPTVFEIPGLQLLPIPNMHVLLPRIKFIFLIGLASRQFYCFRCRMYEQYLIAHRLCIVIFPFVGDTEFTLGEFLIPRRVSSSIAKRITRVSIVEIDKETTLAIARPFDFFNTLSL